MASTTLDNRRDILKASSTDVDNSINKIFNTLAEFGNINYRNEQVRVSSDIYRVLNQKKVGIMESPTGTGKTLAYLTASVVYCKKNPYGQVVISTPTRQLQNQILNDFKKYFSGEKLQIAVLKGKTGYIDAEALNNYLKQQISPNKQAIIKEFKKHADAVCGDIELLNDDIIEKFKSTFEDIDITDLQISPNETSLENLYYLKKAQDRAKAANIVIVNHALFVAYAFFKMNKARKSLLNSLKEQELLQRIAHEIEGIPIRFDNVIVDEAHRIEATVRHLLSYSVSTRKVLSLSKRIIHSYKTENPLIKVNKKELSDISICVKKIESLSTELVKESEQYDTNIIPIKYYEKQNRFTSTAVNLVEYMNKVLSIIDKHIGKKHLGSKVAYEVHQHKRHCDDIIEVITRKPERVSDYKGFGFYVKTVNDNSVTISAVPAFVVNQTRYIQSHFNSIVFVSGTLATESGSFESFKRRAGTKYLTEKSNVFERKYNGFVMKNRVNMYFYENHPHPLRNDDIDDYKEVYENVFFPAVYKKVLNIVKNASKRTLLLCASTWETRLWNNTLTKDGIKAFLYIAKGRDFNSIKQEFESDKKCVLISASIWEGADMDTSDLIVTRLPYASLDDPLNMAIKDFLMLKGDSEKQATGFVQARMKYDVFNKLRQGVGRLFRNEKSKGNIHILDPRAVDYKDYFGRIFSIKE